MMPHRLKRSFRCFPTFSSRFHGARKPLAVVAALACLCALPNRARAQEDDATTLTPGHRAVVLDFEVAPGVDPILGRKAADAIAVEMEASGEFSVVPRQEIERLIAVRSGLLPPYNASTQRRLGAELQARSVITGRITGVAVGPQTTLRPLRKGAVQTVVTPGVREGRVQIQVRQLEVRSGDFVNGTQVTETTTDELAEVDDDVLVNQSIDKAAYAAIRTIRLIQFPEATVMNTTETYLLLNLGFRNGIRPGQRFSVSRDSAIKTRGLNEAGVTVERIKIAEMVIDSVDDNQSRGHIINGGTVGVRTNDKARRIFAEGLHFTEPAFELGSRLQTKPRGPGAGVQNPSK